MRINTGEYIYMAASQTELTDLLLLLVNQTFSQGGERGDQAGGWPGQGPLGQGPPRAGTQRDF